ncbi:LrgB family protein [Paenibacillus sp. GD4]|uniref:LrgB family protein n=1 Tax=Paenibacillus sp. GD4 TaxID=3068890 RepID=UPI002796887C|nr:LrgB family protein [Paenibacillus sp. GD4]MDQ1914523.1 LrgB family protein [Paenibacillus sp. GD4]
MSLHPYAQSPIFGISLTVLAYVVSLGVQRYIRWLHPLFVCSGLIILVLYAGGVPYSDYKIGGSLIEFFLGPATIAMGVPLYKNAQKIKEKITPVIAGIFAGSVMGIVSSIALVHLLGGTREIMLTMMPKSVTTPISVEIIRAMGGNPELGSVLTVLTGLLGSMIGPEVLRRFGMRDDFFIGTAVGTSSHGIGTGRLIRESDLLGSISGFSMCLAGMITSVLVIPIYRLFP